MLSFGDGGEARIFIKLELLAFDEGRTGLLLEGVWMLKIMGKVGRESFICGELRLAM